MTRWLFWALFEWAVIAASLAAAWMWPLLIPLVVLIVGSRQHALLVLGHDAAHRTVGDIDWLANPVCFWWAGADIRAYRREHLRHHLAVGRPHDPEVVIRAQTPWVWKDLTPAKKAVLLCGDLLGFGIRESVIETRAALGVYTLPRVLYVGAAVAAAIVSGLWPLLLLWIWCLFTVLRAMDRARSWREHYDLPPGETHEYVPSWWERLVYLPHYAWKHREHHKPGRWARPAWEL